MLSSIINRVLPAFIRDDHPTFETFLKTWLEFLDDDGPHQHITELKNQVDVNSSDVIDVLKNAYMPSYPATPLGYVQETDSAFLIKHLRDVYRKKGSEAAYRFFFQAQFGEDITIHYPKENVLRLSDGKWQVYQYILFDWNIDTVEHVIVKGFFNKQIRGRTSNATAFVNIPEGADPQFYIDAKELPLKAVLGDFLPNEIIEVII